MTVTTPQVIKNTEEDTIVLMFTDDDEFSLVITKMISTPIRKIFMGISDELKDANPTLRP